MYQPGSRAGQANCSKPSTTLPATPVQAQDMLHCPTHPPANQGPVPGQGSEPLEEGNHSTPRTRHPADPTPKPRKCPSMPPTHTPARYTLLHQAGQPASPSTKARPHPNQHRTLPSQDPLAGAQAPKPGTESQVKSKQSRENQNASPSTKQPPRPKPPVVGCHRPPVPKHGSTEGLFLHSGARVTYHCDPGFKLRGFRTAICLNDGTWSAPAPECVERVCTLPPKPVNGDHLLVYGPNDVLIALQYMCNQPYELIGISQRTCLPNDTWSGTPPVCSKVNNTLTEKDKNKVQEADTGKGIDTESDKYISKTKEIPQQNTTEKENAGWEDIYSGGENTSVDTKDKYTGTIPENTVDNGKDEEDLEETSTGSEKPNRDRKNEVDTKSTDNRVNTVEEKDPESPKPPKKKEDSSDPELEKGKINTTEILVRKDKGQEEKERKEEQVNGKKDSDKFGPNDTKFRTIVSEDDTTMKIFEPDRTKNSTSTQDSKEAKKENNTTGSPTVRKIDPFRVNVTQYTLYRANGENRKMKEKSDKTKDETGKDSIEKTKELERKREENEKDKEINQSLKEKRCPSLPRLLNGYHQVVPELELETVEFMCNHSYALSGDKRRTCQPDGTWSGKQPLCLRACREPKVSELVKQNVLPPQAPSRKTIVHRLLSSAVNQQLQSVGPTKGSPVLPQLPEGFHHLYTHIEYECASQYYHHFGSARRTCLKTGKWSGRHVSCSP
ncbi:hypothetical protein ILYODFUR_007174, partial [Ilyodon furcidens]